MKKKYCQTALILLVVAATLILTNHYLVMSIMSETLSTTESMKLSGDLTEDAIKMAIYEGMPEVYGPELNVSFDNVQQSMNIMKQFDPGYGRNKIELSGTQLQRYIDITTKISCEFCCGAKAISFSDGRPACGCAHSQAMRGLTSYLLANHSEEYSNDQILRELARWKGRYFPKQMIQKTVTQVSSGEYTPDIASLLLGIDVSQYAGKSTPLPSEIQNLPSMVGGC